MYRYIQIGTDDAYSQSLSVSRITAVLRAMIEIEEDNLHGFKNNDGSPWFRINIANCDADGNYPAGLRQDNDIANMVEIIAMDKGDEERESDYTEFARRIAVALNWQIISDSQKMD